MTSRRGPKFLLDEHITVSTGSALQERGVDVLHVTDVELGGTPDPELFRRCQEEGRILVTRNYKDFAPLVEMMNRQGEGFPGILFVSSRIPQSDIGAHVDAIRAWTRRWDDGEVNVTDTFGWLG